MANSEAGTSSDAARASRSEYQVFLSFRGSDTRHGFTDFLYHGLLDAGIRVFKEDDELRVGEVIGENLVHAINNSILYIPIFSQTYAFSTWCLQELALIADNVFKSQDQKSILPIFFDVEPEDVKLKTPVYRTALEKHKEDFPEKVEVWRKALVAVDEIKGWNVKKDLSQATIVKLVVEKVLEKLEIKRKSVIEHLVELDDRVKHLTELLDVNDRRNVRFIGIYGKGGIGKTTVAKVIFNKLSSHFGKCCSFLENVRESSLTKEGIVQLQRKLLSDIVGYGSTKQLMDSEQAMRRIGDTLSTKKVLVVLDDVDKKEHIKRLIGGYSLYLGSRIIITTRNKTVLNIKGLKDEILWYEMLKMDDGLAIRLFCQHAFGREFPLDDYHGLSSKIVSNTGGLPLLVEVIGSLLNGKDEAFWKETLVRLREVPEEDILEMLRISYDNLDKFQQQIFLDIACFLFNENKTDAIYMWADCNIYPIRGLKVLIDRCLIKILDNDKIWMHDQLIDLGRRIVRQESPLNPGKRSRLWIAKEALEIIRTKKRKDEVQALKIFRSGDSIEITDEDFARLQNLRFLELNWGTYVGDFARCDSNLRWFSWHSPRDFRANNMYLDRLVVCKLDAIDFKVDSKAWDLIKRAQNLKVLYVTRCSGITTIPDFSKCSRLERLTLANCFNLERIESFIGDLGSLIELKIKECMALMDLPEEVGALVKLKHFSLSGCRGFRELPGSLGNLTSLTELDLSGTIIRELPNSIVKLKSLRVLRLPIGALVCQEDHVWQLPSGIGTLVNLEELDLTRRNVVGEIPVGIGELSSLRILKLEHTHICRIPTTINMLHHLQTLNLRSCHEIQVLPELPTSLTCLFLRSKSLVSVPNLSNLTNLVELLLSNDSSLGKKSNLIPGCNLRWIGRLHRLKKLELDLLNVPAPPELASLSHLEELKLSCLDVENLMQHPPSSWSLRNLSNLEFYSCEVEDIPLDRLPRLEELTVYGCKRLQKLSIPLELRKLGQVRVSYCSELVEIQVECLSKSLESLKIYECESLTKIGGLSYSMTLEYLRIQRCKQLTNVEGLNELESLKSLEVTQCPSLTRLIDASCTNIPEDCLVKIQGCGDLFKDSTPGDPLGMPLLRYVQEILLDTSNFESKPYKTETEGGKKATAWWEKFRIWRTSKESCTKEKDKVKEKETEGGETATAWRTSEESGNQGMEQEVQELFLETQLKYYYCDFNEESKGDGDGNDRNDIEVEKERGDEEAKGEDGAEFNISGPDEVSYSSSVGQSETDGTFSIDDFHSEPSDKSLEPSNKSLEALENRRQMRDERIGRYDSVDGGKTASMENRNKDKDENVEPANPSDFVGSSCQACEGLGHYEGSCEVAIEIEDQKDLSFMNLPFTIDFILKIKLLGGVFSVTQRKKRDATPNSVTYEGLIADIKGFGFLMKRMWYRTPDEDCELLTEIKGDEQVKGMLQLASQRGLIHLIVEGGVDNFLEGVKVWASQWGWTVHLFVFFSCVAFFLFLSHLRGKLDFPRKIGQFAGMRRFSLSEGFVIFVLNLFLFLGLNYLG